MNWLRRLLGRPPKLSSEYRAAIAAYQSLAAPPTTQPARATRFVVLDVESSGLDPSHDHLLSIGAVVVQDCVIHLRDALEVVLRQVSPSDSGNILIHGIDGTTQMGGQDPREALLEFIRYVGQAPLVGYHVDFDRIMIERAMRRVLGITPHNAWLDLARIVPGLFPKQAAEGRGLDYWLGVFSIENFARHDAVADAVATAQLLQVALARAAEQGMERYADLRRVDSNQAWLERSRSSLR
jgi:DNA polymerase-3 subunit epsilon